MPGPVLHQGAWYVRIKGADGRRRWIHLHASSRREAERRAAALAGWIAPPATGEEAWLRSLRDLGNWAEARLHDLERGGPPADRPPLWEAYSARSRASAGTAASYRTVAARWCAWAAEHGADEWAPRQPDAEAWLEGERDPRRAAGYMATVAAVAGADAGPWRAARRAAPRQRGARYRRLSPEEARAVLAALEARGDDAGALAADWVRIGWRTGMRSGDVAALRVSSVDEGARALRFVPQKTAGRKPDALAVPLCGEAAEAAARALEAARRRGAGPEDLLWPPWAVAWQREAWTLSTPMRRAMREAFASVPPRAGEEAAFHSLRVSLISALDEAGVPPAVTDAVTGHAPQGMHGRYSRPSLAAMRAALERIPPLG